MPFFAFLIEIIFPVLTVIWVIIWFAYWLTPLKHCDYCNRMFTRKILYEKYVPNSTREGVETRIAKRNIKSNSGKVIGSYDESYSVDIETKKYYTVFGCKKCNHAKIEIIEKQFDV